MATIIYNSNEYDIPESILSQYLKPKYNRMQVLRGEWIPPVGTGGCYVVSSNNVLVNVDSAARRYAREQVNSRWCFGEHLTACSFDEAYEKGTRFFPTKELAEEYLLIAEGKWLPKRGDKFIFVDRDEVYTANEDRVIGRDTFGCTYFPSRKQRDEYIAKKKPVRPLVGKEVKLTVDGTEYKATLQ